MASLKQSVKQILADRQYKKYEKEVAAKNLTYDAWIKGKEHELEIAYRIIKDEEKSLTNDSKKEAFGSDKKANEGNQSESDEICHFLTLRRKNGGDSPKISILSVSLRQFWDYKNTILENSNADVILISVYSGEINQITYGLVCEKMAENENIILIYGDEDLQEGEVREKPWFKPDWSPDRFLSCFYFGGLVAVRTRALRETCKKMQDTAQLSESRAAKTENREIYGILQELIRDAGGFEKHSEKLPSPVAHIPQILFHSRENGYEQIRGWKLNEEQAAEIGASLREAAAQKNAVQTGESRPFLSVIIPSKDHTQILFRCLDSFLMRTETKCSFEFIVVDNGSREENRERIAEYLGRIKNAIYLYQPMEFNFSRMCNLGAEKARGELLLFLNDDMEIIQPNWLELMLQKALLPYAGTVGAKLLYPGSATIQHAGITNLHVGPAHKLQFLDDDTVHYFGMNRGVHDMLAVTGACLMLRREVFKQAGGFAEELAVAFNDVDLCYTIYELGYYNIVRNDVTLYHHESLSRGKDGDSREKQLRLLKEKDVLYERHQELYGRDPFYHPCLTGDMLESEYSPACRYQVDLSMAWAEVRRCEREVAKAREDQCLVVGMEAAMDIYKWKYGVPVSKGRIRPGKNDLGYYFQGYSFIIGADNACYKKELLLKNQQDNSIWSLSPESRYRQDIKSNLKDQLNVDLTGFSARLQAGSIPDGIYQFGMLAKDQCSRQRLVNWSNWVLEVKNDEQ